MFFRETYKFDGWPTFDSPPVSSPSPSHPSVCKRNKLWSEFFVLAVLSSGREPLPSLSFLLSPYFLLLHPWTVFVRVWREWTSWLSRLFFSCFYCPFPLPSLFLASHTLLRLNCWLSVRICILINCVIPRHVLLISLTRYDLVYKACGCKCGRGHLKKDLDWVPSLIPGLTDGDGDDESGKKKKKKNRGKKSNVPSTSIASSPPGKDKGPLTTSSSSNAKNNSTSSSSSSLRRQSSSDVSTSSGVSSLSSSSSSSSGNNNKSNSGLNSHPSCSGRNRTFSMSSTGSAGNTSGGASPPIFEGNSSEVSSISSQSPDLVVGQSTSVKRLFFGESDRNLPSYSRSNSLINNNQSYHSKYNLGNNSFSGRERTLSGTMFGRRHDYSTFNILPRSKINSYHIRMEDETSHGNDDIRTLILSTLSANGMNR